MKIAWESWVIAALGLADLITTIVFIEHHGAEEANPLFRHLWEMGMFAFIAGKLMLIACPLAVLEWARKRRPRFTMRALRGGIAGYLVLYGIGFVRLNGPEAQANEVLWPTQEMPVASVQMGQEKHLKEMMRLSYKQAPEITDARLRAYAYMYQKAQSRAKQRAATLRQKQTRQWFENPNPILIMDEGTTNR